MARRKTVGVGVAMVLVVGVVVDVVVGAMLRLAAGVMVGAMAEVTVVVVTMAAVVAVGLRERWMAVAVMLRREGAEQRILLVMETGLEEVERRLQVKETKLEVEG